jgi:hypothetical protein
MVGHQETSADGLNIEGEIFGKKKCKRAGGVTQVTS